MQIFIVGILAILGVCFWSLASVIIHRLKSGRWGILFWRSECPNCQKILSAWELIPIFSYGFQWGKCAGCGVRISPIYPILELSTGISFVISAVYFCDLWAIIAGNSSEIARLVFFLAVSFVSVITAFYDILFMEIPDEILLPSIVLIGILLGWLPQDSSIFRHFIPVGENTLVSNWENAAIGAVGIYTFFYLQFLIPATMYCLKHKRFYDAFSIVLHYILLPFVVIRELFRKGKKTPENADADENELPTWMGLWDLRIGVFIGFVAGAKIAALSVFFAYIIGSIFGIYVLLVKKSRNRAVPFGPFLIIGLFASLLWYHQALRIIFPSLF